MVSKTVRYSPEHVELLQLLLDTTNNADAASNLC